jgi:PEP-CTERM motif
MKTCPHPIRQNTREFPMQFRTSAALVALTVLVLMKPALAANSFKMDFEGIAGTAGVDGSNGTAPIGSYYNGNPGPAFGVIFDGSALAINSAAAGGSGNFATANSGSSAAGAAQGSFRLDLETGQSLTGLEFFFDKQEGAGAGFQLLSGGSAVFSDDFASSCAGTVGTDGYCGWASYKLADSVLADLAAKETLVTGIRFLAESGAVFDDMSLSTTGSSQPVPEPGSFALALLGLTLASGFGRRRLC